MKENHYPGLSDCEREIVDRYNAKGKENPECAACKDRGYIYTSPTSVMPCECKPRKDAARALETSGLTNELRLKTFRSFQTREQWQHALKRKAIAFCGEEGNWFFAGGQVGCGKTHICTAIINELMQKGMIARYMVWPDEVDQIKGNAEDFMPKLRRLMDIPVLYIDDFLKTSKERRVGRDGKVYMEKKPPTAGELNAAFKLLNHRYNLSEKITIISSEFTIDEIMDFDSGLGSRIYQRCKKYQLEVGPDENKNVRLWE